LLKEAGNDLALGGDSNAKTWWSESWDLFIERVARGGNLTFKNTVIKLVLHSRLPPPPLFVAELKTYLPTVPMDVIRHVTSIIDVVGGELPPPTSLTAQGWMLTLHTCTNTVPRKSIVA
jgi:hypothetical protein